MGKTEWDRRYQGRWIQMGRWIMKQIVKKKRKRRLTWHWRKRGTTKKKNKGKKEKEQEERVEDGGEMGRRRRRSNGGKFIIKGVKGEGGGWGGRRRRRKGEVGEIDWGKEGQGEGGRRRRKSTREERPKFFFRVNCFFFDTHSRSLVLKTLAYNDRWSWSANYSRFHCSSRDCSDNDQRLLIKRNFFFSKQFKKRFGSSS